MDARAIMPAVRGIMPGVLARMPRRSVDSDARWMPGVLGRMPRRSVWGWLVAACPAQPGVPADRFARAIVRFLTVFLGRARGS
jgi:hypothetical protein